MPQNTFIPETAFMPAAHSGAFLLQTQVGPASGSPSHWNARNFGCFESDSYLGLSNDARLKAAAQAAIEEFGLSFSASREPFAHAPLVENLEEALSVMFGCTVVAATGIAEAHAAALFAFVMPGDVIIMDSRVNQVLRKSVMSMRASRGVKVEIATHNDDEMLDQKAAAASDRCSLGSRVWYVAQGVDPVSGERMNVETLNELMVRYPMLTAYIDDSHGVGWFGMNGTGTVYDEIRSKERLYLAFSMSHAMAAGGAAVVVPDVDDAAVLRHTGGGKLMLNTPVAPAVLAAACESAWLMQTEEVEDRRLILMGKIQRFSEFCRELRISLLDFSESPLFFIRDGAAGGGPVALTCETKDSDIESLLSACSLFRNQF